MGPPPEVTLEKPQRETMIVSSTVCGTYQGVNANIANRGANGAGWYPGAMLDLGPESLDSPLDLPVPHCLCDPYPL